MEWKRWVMHNLKVALIIRLKHVAALRNEIRLSIHVIMEVGKGVLATFWALTDWNNFKNTLNVHWLHQLIYHALDVGSGHKDEWGTTIYNNLLVFNTKLINASICVLDAVAHWLHVEHPVVGVLADVMPGNFFGLWICVSIISSEQYLWLFIAGCDWNREDWLVNNFLLFHSFNE